jgi:hypothetical protein
MTTRLRWQKTRIMFMTSVLLAAMNAHHSPMRPLLDAN